MHRDQLPAVALRLSCLALGIGLVSGGLPAEAANKKAGAVETKNRIALFPVIAAKGVNVRTAGAIEAALLDGVAAAQELKVVHGRELRRKLRTDPARLVAKCERRRRFAACFAKIAKKLRVRELLLARAAPGEESTKLVVLAITPARAVEARTSLKFETADQVPTVMSRPVVLRIFGLDVPETVPPAEPLALADAGQAGEAAAQADSADPAARPEGAGDQDETGSGSGGASTEGALAQNTTATIESPPGEASAMVEPDAAEPAASDIMALDGWQPSAGTVAATDQPGIGPNLVAPVESTSNAFLRYGGISLAVAGAGALGAGVFFGTETDRYRKSITRDGSMKQHEALAVYNNANDAAQIATILFIGGGVVMAVGATLFGIDLAF